MKKPNIIFILSDQHNKKIMGNSGNKYVKTPNLDWLALKGTKLENCYCASPLCVPSRSALLSGRLPSKTGVFNNMQCLRTDEPTFVHSLAIAGYETVLSGRMHFNGPDQRHGFEKRFVGDITPSFPGRQNKVYGILEETSGQNIIAINKSGAGYSNVLAFDNEVVNAACNYLENRKDKRPIFMMVGFYGPHCPYVCPKDLYDYYYNILPEPETLTNEEKEKIHPSINKWIKNRGVNNVTAKDIRRVRAAYYGMVTYLDNQIGMLLDKIDKTLGFENTMIIYASDHGDNLGYNGLFWKTNFYENAVSVPVIISYPNYIPNNKTIKELTSLLDIAPTLIDFTGGPNLFEYDGINIIKALKGEESLSNKRTIISQLADIKGDAPSAMIRKENWKLVSHYGYDRPQLFNILKDPDEKNDLGNDKKYFKKANELLSELKKYWNDEEIYNKLNKALIDVKILKKWAKTTSLKGIEEWQGNINNNILFD